MTRLALLPLLALAACTSPGVVGAAPGDGDVPLPDGGAFDGGALRELRLEPADPVVTDDGVAPGETVDVRLYGVFEDGLEIDLTDRADWSVERPTLGAVDAGRFTSAGIGGASRLVAAVGGRVATTTITVLLDVTVIVDGAPADAPTRFEEDPSGDGTGALTVVYPASETMLPRNLSRVTPQWVADPGLALFELRIDSDHARLRLYTIERALPLTGDAWRWIAETHAGGSAQLMVRGLGDGAAAERSAPVTLHVSESEVMGALYYWSTGAQGVMRAQISSASPELFYDDPAADDRECVSCHTVSRDGRRLAVGYGGEHLREVSVPDRELLIPADPADEGPAYGWGTFDPAATRLLYANDGELSLLDADTGASIGGVEMPPDVWVTHPDWSPDGTFVVVALQDGGRAPGNKDVDGTSIARIEVAADGSFGEPTIVVASGGGEDTLFFPSVSPDSRWIAYVRAVGKSKDNPEAVLELVRADGSAPPIALTVLNGRVGAMDGVVDIGNSMPTWAPSTGAEVFWLAFSSLRDYGWLRPASEEDQLWGAAIDPSRAERGLDPSFAAFWMPFQQADEGNHRAFWALSDDDVCPPPTIEVCDGLDNDCDAVVDEDCCEPVEEICDDGVDNDCDGVPDEGCGCQAEEVCDNGVDDDCDMAIDGADEDCVII